MLALTLWRPWDRLIVTPDPADPTRGIKPIENRPWEPGRRLKKGDTFAVHAGKKWDDSCINFAASLGVPTSFFDGPPIHSAIVGVVRFEGVRTGPADGWYFGPFGWVLSSPVKIEPVPCKGAQGLWRLSEAVEGEVRRRAGMPERW